MKPKIETCKECGHRIDKHNLIYKGATRLCIVKNCKCRGLKLT